MMREQMNLGQALAAVALWNTRRYDTVDIAEILGVPEADVERALHTARELRRAGE